MNQVTLRIAWFCRNHISSYSFSSFRNQESKLNTAISSNYTTTQCSMYYILVLVVAGLILSEGRVKKQVNHTKPLRTTQDNGTC